MDHRGNSSTSQRIDFMKQYIDVFGVPSIQTLLGDQEFVGDEWLTYLAENNISFSIHLRKDLYIEAEDGRRFQFSLLLHKKAQWTVERLVVRHRPRTGKFIAP